MERKPAGESAIENQVYEIFPNDLNPQGNIFGSRVLELIDILGGIAARRHSEKICVTASMDGIDFISPAKSGDLLVFKAAVNKSWNTSCEVGIKVFVEDHKTKTRKHLASAYLTFVALDKSGKPTSMPKIMPETKNEKRRLKEAEKRRRIRLERRNKKKMKTKCAARDVAHFILLAPQLTINPTLTDNTFHTIVYKMLSSNQ